jgi:hypothetical protein
MLIIEVSGGLITMDHRPSQENKGENTERIKGFKPPSKITWLLMKKEKR